MTTTTYRENFETDNPVSFWSAIGDYEVNYAGLTSERSHCGSQSYKLDITILGNSRNSFWSGPVLDVPAVAGTRFSGHILLEQVPEHAEVSLGIGFYLPALERIGRDEARGSRMMLGSFNARSETGRWHQQSSDVQVAADGMSLKLVGEVTPGLRFEKWHINIQCREAVDERLVLYIDDISLEGGDVPADWEQEQERLLQVWTSTFRARARSRQDRFRQALVPLHEEAKSIAEELSKLQLPADSGRPWEDFAEAIVAEARGLSARLLAGTAPNQETPEQDKAVEVHLHDLWDRYIRPTQWGLEHAALVHDREAPYLLAVCNDPITNHRLLPSGPLLSGDVDGAIELFACAGEYVPASLAVVPETATVATFEPADLRGDNGTIPADCLDLKLVKVWYQAGVELGEVNDRILTPELLLNDDALVQVDTGRQENTVRHIDRPQDADELCPVPIPAMEARQFWLTVRVPEAAAPGIYQGSIRLRLAGVGEHDLPVRLEVLPIELSDPVLHYGIYYRGILSSSRTPEFVSSDLKTEQQLEAEFRDLKAHGILYPDVYQQAGLRADGSLDVDDLERYLDIRDRAGLPGDKLFYNGSSVGARDSEESLQELVEFCRQLIAWARDRGFEEVYFFGSDEAFGEELAAQRRSWSRVRELGGKMTVACSTGFFDLVGDLLDLPIMARMSADEVPRVHDIGHQIYNYSMPQGGEEQPFKYRYFFGHWLLRSGMDGSHTYAYQHALGLGESMGRPWDDFDNAIYRSHMLTYPTVDGIVGTLQWEGVRAAVDDVRYATTLREAATSAIGSADPAAVALGEAARAWLEQVDILGDLGALRREMVDHILELQSSV
ncbi:MAG: hypothetical protein VCF24_02250 [Candidatus Latescibacterota bacterium]